MRSSGHVGGERIMSARPPVQRDANGREIINGHVIENGIFRPPVLHDPPDEKPLRPAASPSVHEPEKIRRGPPPRASWAWAGNGGYYVRIRGRDAELQAGKKVIVKQNDRSNPVEVVLRNLVEWSAGNKTDPPIALYSFGRVSR
jgi:hypothetical protein